MLMTQPGAITSQNLAVSENTLFAEEQFEILQERGISDAMVGATPDFATLFTQEGKYASILSDAGYDKQLQDVREKARDRESASQQPGLAYASGEAGSTPAPSRLRHLHRAAARLAELKRRREAESAGALALYLWSGEVYYKAGSRERSGRGISANRGGIRLKTITADEFSAVASANKASNKFGSAVDVRSAADYAGFDLILLRNGDRTVTISISPDGEVGSVTKSETADREQVKAAMQAAASTGQAKWLNGFDTILPDLYSKFGFEPVARVAFDDQYAPQGWDYELYSKFNGGRPDVVFMRYTGVPVDYDSAKAVPVGSYDEAAAMAKAKVEAQSGSQKRKDTRFSASNEQDRDYLAAVERKDISTAQRIVNAVAKAAGYIIGPSLNRHASDSVAPCSR